MKSKSKKMNKGKALTIGAGIVALAAASYFFLGPNGKKNTQKTKAWMTKMKRDVVKKLESAQDITKEKYDTIVDTVAEAYIAVAESKDEVAKLAKELKSHWKSISTKATQDKKKVAKKASKVTKK